MKHTDHYIYLKGNKQIIIIILKETNRFLYFSKRKHTYYYNYLKGKKKILIIILKETNRLS